MSNLFSIQDAEEQQLWLHSVLTGLKFGNDQCISKQEQRHRLRAEAYSQMVHYGVDEDIAELVACEATISKLACLHRHFAPFITLSPPANYYNKNYVALTYLIEWETTPNFDLLSTLKCSILCDALPPNLQGTVKGVSE